MNILDFFSHPTSKPRQGQIDVLEQLAANIDKKYFIIEAPVGSGKSHIAVTFARYLQSVLKSTRAGFLMTPQKVLQRQYELQFTTSNSGVSTLYGKSNYECKAKSTTCDIGGLSGGRCSPCAHKEALNRSIESPLVVLNYTLGMIAFRDNMWFQKRPVMIFDEAHNLERAVVDMHTQHISRYFCSNRLDLSISEFPSQQDGAEYCLAYIEQEYLPALEVWIDEQTKVIEDLIASGKQLTKTDAKQLRLLEDMSQQQARLSQMIEGDEYAKGKWVYVNSPIANSKTDIYGFGFKPATAAELFTDTVDHMADKFVFMSGTILDWRGYCRDLGIDPKECAFITIPTPFDIDNRPVKYIPLGNVNASWMAPDNTSSRDTYLDGLVTILTEHKGDSGVIHTASYSMARWLVNELKNHPLVRHQLFHHNPRMDSTASTADEAETEEISRRDATIAAYLTSAKHKPSILISPSCTEGLDLVGNLGRFSIIAKIPFGFLGDNWIKHRMKVSPEWYARQALIGVIQGAGRVCRTMDDWGVTYIIDASWKRLYNNNKNMLPGYWLDAYEH